MIGFVSFEELVEDYGLPEINIKMGMLRYRQGKTKKWENIKSPHDSRMRLIKLDSIPEPTRKKYNLPTEKEYITQIQINQHELKEAEKRLEYEYRIQELRHAYNNNYKKLFENHSNPKLPEIYAREHAFWCKVVELSGSGYRAIWFTLKPIFGIYNELKKEIPFRIQITDYAGFSRRVNEMRRALYYKKDISGYIVTQKFFQDGSAHRKTTPFHKAMALVYLSHPKMYPYRVVTDLINHHTEAEELNTISESWVKHLVQTDKKFKSIVEAYRYGKKQFNDSMATYVPRQVSPYPANLWMIDGTPVQFWCWNENRTKLIHLYLFTVIDVCTRKIVGFDIAFSEDRFIVANTLKMAIELKGHLPSEIVSDNFSANKTEEIKDLKAQMEQMGMIWRNSTVGNAQDKAYAERFIGTFQSVENALYDDYLGEGITSKRKNAQPDKGFLAEVARKKGYAGLNEMRTRIAQMICKYNERAIGNRKAPLAIYKELPKPNAIALDPFSIALLFWKKTPATIRRSMVTIHVKKQKYHYEIKDHALKLELHQEKITIRYDEKDLSRIMLFSADSDTVICECEQIVKVNIAQIDRTDADEFETYKQTVKKKSFKKYIQDEAQSIVASGLESVGRTLDEFETVHPLSLEKNQINHSDSLYMMNYYLNNNNIDQETITAISPLKIEPEFLQSQTDVYNSFMTRKKPRNEATNYDSL